MSIIKSLLNGIAGVAEDIVDFFTPDDDKKTATKSSSTRNKAQNMPATPKNKPAISLPLNYRNSYPAISDLTIKNGKIPKTNPLLYVPKQTSPASPIDALIKGINSKNYTQPAKTTTNQDTVKQASKNVAADLGNKVKTATQNTSKQFGDALMAGLAGKKYESPAKQVNKSSTGVAGKDTKSNTNIGSNLIGLNPFYNLRPTNTADKATRDAVAKFRTTGESVAPYSNEYLEKQSALAFPRDSKYNNKKENIFEDTTTDTSSLRRDFHNETTFNKEKVGTKSEGKDNSSIKKSHKPTDDQYNQILNSSFNKDFKDTFAPNKKGYSEMLSTDTSNSNVQLFTTQKHVEKGFLKEQGWESITYVFVTLPVSEWQQLVETVDFYDENLSRGVGDIISFIGAYIDDRTGGQPGEAVSMLYQEFDEWASKDLENVVVDKFSRYVSKKLNNKKSSEEVSLLVGAYCWENKEDSSTGEWNTKYLAYGYPWSQELNFFN